MFARAVYQLVYPPTCLACAAFLADDDGKICGACRSQIKELSIHDELYREKREQLLQHGHIAGLASRFRFEKDGTLQNLIHQLKYDEMTVIGLEFGRMLAETFPAMLGECTLAGIVPVPLHPVKQRERGYNQSLYIARGISERTGIVVLPNLLRRTRHTRSQTKLNADERRVNVAEAFAVNRRSRFPIGGSTLLLVDDIITTGATIVECAKALKAAGARRVFAASLAIPDTSHMP